MQLRSSSTKTNKNIEKEFKNLRKELLDLTLRNPLLNFKLRNRNLSIINQSPMNMYKILVLENKKMFFSANKKETTKSKAHAFISQTKEFLSSEGDKALKADLSPSELQKRLFYIDQQAKTMVQEQGYNILYIALGFIEWIDNKKPNQRNLAPLILIPVAMERKKVGNSFSLSWTGEDLQNNISIQAKLREEGINLPNFEQTSYIEGVNQYLDTVRKAISPFKKWKVNDNVALGFFSFTKFVMYNDLNPESWSENVDLTKNELIQAIFNPSKNVYEDTFEEEDVDEKLHYKTMYQVLDADSSQIAVIENVKAGHNLVVEGPPGTGKSQTIVNLIAELIAEGKTVLFVSEKMAALEVVKSRLDSVGLGKFVLELHSHKTRRKKLLKNLQKATNVRDTRNLKLDQTLRKLENLRNQLDEYAEVIHKPFANVNLSPFELYGMKESSEDYFARQNRLLPLVRFNNPEDISMKELDDIIITLENLSELYSTISKNNPWSYCNPKSLLPADLREIELLIRDTLDSLNEFKFEMDLINETYGIKIPNTLKEYEDSITALEILNSNSLNLVDNSILLNKEWFNNPEKAIELINLLENYQNASIFNKFSDYLLKADLDNIIIGLEKNLNKKFRLFGGNSYKEDLLKLYNGNVPNEKQALSELKKVRQDIKIRQSIKDNESLAQHYFGVLWSEKANINELKEVFAWMEKFVYLISNGTFNENTVKSLSNNLFHPNMSLGIEEYVEKGNNFYSSLKKLESKLNPRSKIIFKRESDDVPFDDWELQLNKWRGQLSSLHLWSQYSNAKKACMNTPSSIFIKTIEKRNIKKEDVKSLVLGNFSDSLLNIVFNENNTLATFIGELHENRIEEFKDLDKKIINLNRKRIFNKLNSEIPKIFGGAEDPEAKVLAGEFTRKSGHLPVRTLLEKAGGIIKKIKPIFMMSPLSIAQYLDPTNPKLQFDVVIFDEASQVKPEDALGAFMRGKTAVVMGDTQQLPPTSFFDQMTDSESGEEVATALDMESILHLCKLSFPVKMLKWHYRSRHESLINISNSEFYDNELLVYPSPSRNDSELGLKFHYNPNTAYHRGEGSANPKEAKDVVKEIFRHFVKYGDKKSLGVGTFSVAQKNAILEELEIERKAHPEYEPLFSDKREERFFVKNLETIQGDERDVILISVGYGYDTERKMSLNFGPLNQDGGERRLNVLITRAREKCVVFANFRAHDIHLTANPPFGVKSLQSFLEYAENLQLNQFTYNQDFDESPFEDAIYNFLSDKGYQIDKKVGCAGFRVDLAIIDEENPGKYILGIQCDGNNYASSKVARDRDRLREQVLNGLGWNIYHIWSTDWYRNRDLARSKLLEKIESSIIDTKVNDLTSKIHEVESMKINPVTSIIIDKPDSNDKENISDIDEIKDKLDSNDKENISDIDEIKDKLDSNDKENISDIDEIKDKLDSNDKENISDIDEIKDKLDSNDKENISDIDGIDDKYNNEDSINNNNDNNIYDNDFKKLEDVKKTVEIKKELIVEELAKEKEKQNLINEYISNFDKEFNNDSINSKKDLNNIVTNSNIKSDIKNKDTLIDNPNEGMDINISTIENDDNSINNPLNKNKLDNLDTKNSINKIKHINEGFVYNSEGVEKSINPVSDDSDDFIDIEDTEYNNSEDFIDIEDTEYNNSEDFIDIEDTEYNNSEDFIDIEDTEFYNDDSDDLNNDNKDNFDNIKSSDDIETEEFEDNKMKYINIPKKKEKEYNESSDYIVPITAETREESSNNYDANANYIVPINQEKSKNLENNDSEKDENLNDSSNSNDELPDKISNQNIDNNQMENLAVNNEDNDKINRENNINSQESYYYSAVGMDNVLRKNAVHYPRNKPNKKGLAGAVSNFKNEMLYINAALSEIENPSEKEKIYVIDRTADDKYYEEYDNSTVKQNVMTPENNYFNESNYISESGYSNDLDNESYIDATESIPNNSNSKFNENLDKTNNNNTLFNSKKHEYLDKINEYEYISSKSNSENRNSDNSFDYSNNYLNEYEESVEPIIPLNHSNNDDINYQSSIKEYSKEDKIIMDNSKDIISSTSDEFNTTSNNDSNQKGLDDELLESIISDIDQDYQKIEKERIKESNVLNSVDNTRLTPTGELNDYISEYKEIEDLIIKNPTEIYDNKNKLSTVIIDTIATEGPVHEDIVIRRIRESCGLSRAGTKFKNTILESISNNESEGKLVNVDSFLFINYDQIVVRKRIKPNIDLISDLEIEKAIDLVISFNKSMNVKELSKQVSRLFGFKSTSKKTSTKIISVVDAMIGQGKLVNNDNKIEFR